MPLPSFATIGRWTPIATIVLVTAAAVGIALATAHAALACGCAVTGFAAQTVLLVHYRSQAHRRAVHIAGLQAALAVALQDPVTGLAVRQIAEQRLFRTVGAEVTVALIDVDGMHDVNTTLTHDGGDRYLAEVADRLRAAAEPGDLVARLGGDEFVVLTARPALVLARALRAAFVAPVTIGARTLLLRVSIGICRTPGGDPHVALGRADRAMYTAKRRGGGVEHYDAARDGEPLAPGVRPPVRHRDRRPAPYPAGNP
ncbi:GGDEF domain-containing protein [Dactylosporangium sp. McL0621]|uniref:GGDEF domain-containing protein n=1 Tax=Dactylosporangium sp. McL0621 TaxID=3415678 RepID=UPI003CEA84C1